MPGTNRCIRTSDLVWAAVQQRARLEGTTITRIAVAAFCEYVSKPLPAKPERKQGKRVAAPAGKPLDALGEACSHGDADRIVRGVCLSCGQITDGSE